MINLYLIKKKHAVYIQNLVNIDNRGYERLFIYVVGDLKQKKNSFSYWLFRVSNRKSKILQLFYYYL